jgi:hypothetical protein
VVPTTTTRLGLHRPTTSDLARVPQDLETLTDQLDDQMVVQEQGTFAARPPAGVPLRLYWADDRKLLYQDTGTSWRQVSTWTLRSMQAGTIGEVYKAGSASWGGNGHTTVGPQPTITVPYAGTFRVRVWARFAEGSGNDPNTGIVSVGQDFPGLMAAAYVKDTAQVGVRAEVVDPALALPAGKVLSVVVETRGNNGVYDALQVLRAGVEITPVQDF